MSFPAFLRTIDGKLIFIPLLMRKYTNEGYLFLFLDENENKVEPPTTNRQSSVTLRYRTESTSVRDDIGLQSES